MDGGEKKIEKKRPQGCMDGGEKKIEKKWDFRVSFLRGLFLKGLPEVYYHLAY